MLVLASASPRRRELLAALGVDFEVRPSHVPEVPNAHETPVRFVARLAREKAAAVARPGEWVLGADTIVVVDAEILGKPEDAAGARRMLERLSGRAHHVLTAVALVGPGGEPRAEILADTLVEFRELAAEEIAAYVAGGEPMDKAGAYAIQGGAGKFVRRIAGSYSNVVGLPQEEVAEILDRYGIRQGTGRGAETE